MGDLDDVGAGGVWLWLGTVRWDGLATVDRLGWLAGSRVGAGDGTAEPPLRGGEVGATCGFGDGSAPRGAQWCGWLLRALAVGTGGRSGLAQVTRPQLPAPWRAE